MNSTEPPQKPASGKSASHLRSVKVRGNILMLALLGAASSVAGLFLLTGLISSAWLLLLYPVLIGILLISLGTLALHLLHRF